MRAPRWTSRRRYVILLLFTFCLFRGVCSPPAFLYASGSLFPLNGPCFRIPGYSRCAMVCVCMYVCACVRLSMFSLWPPTLSYVLASVFVVDAWRPQTNFTPLMKAAEAGHLEVTELLLKNGANQRATTQVTPSRV